MNKRYLAVPAATLLSLSASLSVFAQTDADPPQTPPTATAAPAPTTLTDEQTARLMLTRKEYHEAEMVFRRLVHEQPKNAVYWNELGISLQNQTELSAALKCYEKSVKLDPRYSDAQNNVGTIWYERKKYPKAIRAYQKAIGIRDDFAAF